MIGLYTQTFGYETPIPYDLWAALSVVVALFVLLLKLRHDRNSDWLRKK